MNVAIGFRPIERLTVDAWADKYRYLAPIAASRPGKFKTANVEIGRGPMRAVTTPGVKTITCMVATQLLKTTLLENVLAFFVHQKPAPMLLAFPKLDLARSFSKERLRGMIRATPVMLDILGDSHQDKSESSLYYKEFSGGFIALASAASPSDLAMRPIKVTLADEIDKYEPIKGEGNPLLLLEERTATFKPYDLHIRCSSPTVTDTSNIQQSFNDSDQRRPFLECPHCHRWQTFDFFKHVIWTKVDGRHDTASAVLVCPECKEPIDDAYRHRMVTTEGGIRWQQARKFKCCAVDQVPTLWDWSEQDQVGYALCAKCGKRAVPHEHAGFTASKIFSPWTSIPELAATWIESKSDQLRKQVFYNTVLGESFEGAVGKRLELHNLRQRCENFRATLSTEICVLTCGVDTQDDRIEAHVVAWTPFFEAFSIYYKIFPGDPSTLELWDKLDEFLRSSFPSDYGFPLPIRATCIDSGGHHTQMVYNFCRARTKSNIWAVKGSSWSREGDPIWPQPESRKHKRRSDVGFKPMILGTNALKDFAHGLIHNDTPGPNYLHIPRGRSDGWLSQLTSEFAVLERVAGQTVRRWHLPPGRANEAFDTLCYATAAVFGLKSVKAIDMHVWHEQLLEHAKQFGKAAS